MIEKVQKIETMEFDVQVTQHDIDNSDCLKARKCMIKVAMERTLRDLSGNPIHHSRVDAGHATFHWQGYRYIADMPKKGKAALIKFDMEDKLRKKAVKAGEKFVSGVRPFKLTFRGRKVAKLPKNTPERTAQINAARRARVAGGQKQERYTLRDRIVGFA